MPTLAHETSLLKNRGDRMKAIAAVAALHAALGYAFLTGLSGRIAEDLAGDLKIFDIPIVPPPPLNEAVQERPAERAEGEASPPNLEADPSPVAAPKPAIEIPVPPPVTAAPKPTAAVGNDVSAGAASVAGPGTGSGGIGNGTGAGGQGNGPGGGGGGRKAQRERGNLSDRDYPAAAARFRAEGTVFIRFTVRRDGSVSGCTVTQSSGHRMLDETTCRLVERRFRYRPALDAQGRPVEEVVTTNFSWGPKERM